ncbi:hypothetical protein AB3S75_046314 [Citrus x aurantiifolia]
MAAPPPAHQSDKLVTVGKEGFDLLDEFNGRPNKSGGRLSSTQPRDHRHQYPGLREPVTDSNQAAQYYVGAVIEDYSTRKGIYSVLEFINSFDT